MAAIETLRAAAWAVPASSRSFHRLGPFSPVSRECWRMYSDLRSVPPAASWTRPSNVMPGYRMVRHSPQVEAAMARLRDMAKGRTGFTPSDLPQRAVRSPQRTT